MCENIDKCKQIIINCPLHVSDETHEQYRPRKVPFGLTDTQIDWPPLVRQRYLRFYSPV